MRYVAGIGLFCWRLVLPFLAIPIYILSQFWIRSTDVEVGTKVMLMIFGHSLICAFYYSLIMVEPKKKVNLTPPVEIIRDFISMQLEDGFSKYFKYVVWFFFNLVVLVILTVFTFDNLTVGYYLSIGLIGFAYYVIYMCLASVLVIILTFCFWLVHYTFMFSWNRYYPSVEKRLY